jgi:hypothetical protein
MTEPRTKAGRALLARQAHYEIWHPVDARRDKVTQMILDIEAEADTLGAAISDPNDPLLAEAQRRIQEQLPPATQDIVRAVFQRLPAALLAAHGKGEA